jgi:hypothetical protein
MSTLSIRIDALTRRHRSCPGPVPRTICLLLRIRLRFGLALSIGGGADGQDVVLVYGQTHRFNGWTIVSTFDGTRLTNDGTGHGMFVAIDGVSSF